METNQSISSKLANIAIATGLSILIVAINIAIFTNLFPFYDTKIAAKNIPWKQVVMGLTISPLGEELIFRLIPISLFKTLTKSSPQIFEESKWYAIAIIACVFGYIHGGYYNIFIQGIAGFAFGWVYIKNGMSYWSAVITHFLYNFMIYVIFPTII